MAVAVAVFAGGAAAWAAPAWLAPADLSPAERDALYPEVAVDPAGNAVVLATEGGGTSWTIRAVTRQPGGEFAAPVDLSAASVSPADGKVAIDAAGNAVAVWGRDDGVNGVIQAATRPPGASFSAPVNISGGGVNEDPQVAMDAAGGAVAVWTGPAGAIEAATRSADGSFSAPFSISGGGSNANPQVAMDAAGNAIAVWEHFDGANWIVQAATRAAGGSFSAPTDLSAAGQSASTPQVAMNGAGRAVVVWARDNGASWIIEARTRPAGGSFSTTDTVSQPSQNAFDPQVALDASGNAMAVWRRSDGVNWIVQAAAAPPGEGFSTPIDLSAPGEDAVDPRLALGPGGAVAVWERFDGTNWRAQAAVRAVGGGFSAPVDLSPAGQDAHAPRAAVDAAGNALAVWQRSNGTHQVVQAAAFDAAPPQLRDVSVPASGTVGVPVSVSASPFDAWSAVSASWSFGDGASGSGTAATHTYTAPGTYQIRVTATDAVGNATSAARQITITAPPASPTAKPATPAITGLRISPTTFRAAARGASIAAVSTGARVSYRVNIAAKVTFTVQRRTNARRVGRRCVKATRANRKRPSCIRYVRMTGSFARTSTPGANGFGFTGRLRKRKLAPGRYRLVATPAAGTARGRSASVAFRIRR